MAGKKEGTRTATCCASKLRLVDTVASTTNTVGGGVVLNAPQDGTGNLSKQRREELVKKIAEIRRFLAKSSDTNAVRLVAFADELAKEVKAKKYGLVFEEHKEKIDVQLEHCLPLLTEDKDRFIDNGGELNFLIEGDNLAALKLLEKTHRGKIDLIYIDPPYNTGNKDFVYNDCIVDANDTFRHSKWLSFMKKRLEIARRLLTNKGVIFISIDDNEQAPLRILCDAIFGEGSFVANFVWTRKKKGAFLSKKVRKMSEYILCYQRNEKSDVELYGENAYSDKWQPIVKRTNALKTLVFPANVVATKLPDGKVSAGFKGKQGTGINLLNELIVKDGRVANQFAVEARFTWQQSYLDEEIKKGTKVDLSKLFGFNVFRYNQAEKVKAPSTLINGECGVGTNEDATQELQQLFQESADRVFQYSKPTSLMEYIVNMATHNVMPGPTVLDFFAGSGTTGHAVMSLNAKDGGKRKFILVTNNENGICEKVTYERLKRVIAKEKYAARLKYMKIDYLPIEERMYDRYAEDLLKHVRELVELENGLDFERETGVAIVLTDAEAEALAKDRKRLAACRVIYRGHSVLLDAETAAAFAKSGATIRPIPKYYYPELEY